MIGIVGGTFDPVHYGHLRPVHRLTQQLNLSKVLYVLSARPPHRQLPVASIPHRLNMLMIAVEEFPAFEADDQEVSRAGPSFTLWTLRRLRQQYGQDALCLILGMDAFLGIESWYRWPEVISLTNILVLARPGFRRDANMRGDGLNALSDKRSGAIVFADSLEVPLTASDIRRRLAAGEDVRDALPAAVLEYIQANKIYSIEKPYERRSHAS